MQLQAMRVSGLIGAPCCDVAAYTTTFQSSWASAVRFWISKERGDNKRRRSGERREGWKEKRESSLGGQTQQRRKVFGMLAAYFN
jgi:hypothetical protein